MVTLALVVIKKLSLTKTGEYLLTISKAHELFHANAYAQAHAYAVFFDGPNNAN